MLGYLHPPSSVGRSLNANRRANLPILKHGLANLRSPHLSSVLSLGSVWHKYVDLLESFVRGISGARCQPSVPPSLPWLLSHNLSCGWGGSHSFVFEETFPVQVIQSWAAFSGPHSVPVTKTLSWCLIVRARIWLYFLGLWSQVPCPASWSAFRAC